MRGQQELACGIILKGNLVSRHVQNVDTRIKNSSPTVSSVSVVRIPALRAQEKRDLPWGYLDETHKY